MGTPGSRIAAMLLVLSAGARAQFSNLALTTDASQIYFASDLRLTAESSQNLPSGSAIYRIAGGTITRVTDPLGLNPLPYHVYSQGNAQVSSDGSVFSYTAYSNCYGGSACITFPSNATSYLTVNGQAYDQSLKGEAQVSRNGRFVLNFLTVCCPIPAQPNVIQYRDLQTESLSTLPLPPAGRTQALIRDGTALLLNLQTGVLTLWTPQSSRNLTTASPAKSAIVNDQGTWVVYETFSGTEADLRAVEIATGRDVLLSSQPEDFWVSPVFGSSISDDGTTVLYRAPAQSGQPVQLWTVHPDGTGLQQLASFSQDVSEAVLSGNAATAVAVTGGQLVSIDVATAAVQVLIPVTPTCSTITQTLAPGSLFGLIGTGLAASTQSAVTPLPTKLGGAQVLLNTEPLPLLMVSPTAIWFQLPFEASPGTTATLAVSYGSPFVGCSLTIPITGRSPYFFPDSSGNTLFIHQGFSGLVNTVSPAQPGEIVTAYALGLGGVSPSLPTGVLTPIGPLYPLNWPFACYQDSAYDNGPMLDVPFAGLAPGMVGIYQLNIRMPDTAPADGWLALNCGTPGNIYERAGAVIPVAVSTQ